MMTVFILTKIWLVKAYYSAEIKDKLAGLERSVNNSVFVCFMTRSQRDAFMLAVFQVAKSMGEENTCSSPPSVPSLSLCSLERCHLIKPQVLQTGKWKPEVWRNVNEVWWEISHCWTVYTARSNGFCSLLQMLLVCCDNIWFILHWFETFNLRNS